MSLRSWSKFRRYSHSSETNFDVHLWVGSHMCCSRCFWRHCFQEERAMIANFFSVESCPETLPLSKKINHQPCRIAISTVLQFWLGIESDLPLPTVCLGRSSQLQTSSRRGRDKQQSNLHRFLHLLQNLHSQPLNLLILCNASWNQARLLEIAG